MMDISKRNQLNRGFTLIELLVVIVIATVVLSVAIPRIRTINKERNLREAARVVGSAMANASQRAIIDGVAGVRITRNPNFINAAGNEFAATEVSILRAVPNYSGDQFDDKVLNLTGGSIQIRKPLEQDALNIIQNGDSISFGGSSVEYRITSGVPDPPNAAPNLDLTLGRGTNDYMPLPSVPDDLTAAPVSNSTNPSFVIHRRPRVLRSSTVSLPNGNIVDLSLSGFEQSDVGLGGGLLSFGGASTIDVVFGEDGEVDQVFFEDDTGTVTRYLPLGPVYLMIAEAPVSDPAPSPLIDDQSLWVAVSPNGSTNIGYNNSSNGGDPDNDDDVAAAREGSLTTSATQ